MTTGANGQAIPPTIFNVPANTLADTWITATATDQAGDTSEFSTAFQLSALVVPGDREPSIASSTYGQAQTFTATVAPFVSASPLPRERSSSKSMAHHSVRRSRWSMVRHEHQHQPLPAGAHDYRDLLGRPDLLHQDGDHLADGHPGAVDDHGRQQEQGLRRRRPGPHVHGDRASNGDTSSVISGVTLSTTTGAAATAGTHTITATGGTAANYTITDVNGTLTVSKAPLTVTADNKSKVYGAADPTLTYTPSGTLYYGDTYSVISGVTLSTTTGAAATAGTHTITASGGTAANYAITDVNGTLTVTALPVVTVSSVKIETVHLKKKKTDRRRRHVQRGGRHF